MTYNELNEFILNYLENDITGRAIMLTGGWGSGKSYYVKNTLKPFLEEKKHKCAIVSLYGLTDVSEISKAIYMELRTIMKETESESGNTAKVVGKIVGKTLINGLVSKIGFEIGNISDDDIQKVYDSINLSGKLIVLEDIERTQIDIRELLGYINNMCENDGVKVLLVSNEDELIVTYDETTEEGNKVEYYTDDTISYKRAKEKTIGDTIRFECDYVSTIQEIISPYNIYLKKYCNVESAEDIKDIFFLVNSYNLRAFIYACQKCNEIFKFIYENQITINKEVNNKIFYGIIAFTQRQSKGGDLTFDRDKYFSAELGLNDIYPLFRFCYDYIVYQFLSFEEVCNTIKNYNDFYRHSTWNSGRDEDIKIIKNFHIRTEKEVADAVLNLPKKIINNSIPFCDYGALINYLIAIKYDAEIDIRLETIEKNIIENLKRAKVSLENIFNSGYTLYSDKAIEEFNLVKNKMKEAISEHDNTFFPYEPALLSDYYSQNIAKINATISQTGFLHNVDINRLIEMLKICSSEQISIIRDLILTLYRSKRYDQVRVDDILALNELRDKIIELRDFEGYDKIQKMQIKWLSKNLTDIVCVFNH